MTRFNIVLDEGIEMVFKAIRDAWGGEIFVPKIPSYRITDLAKAVAPNCKQEVIGIRPGEKIHEEMITESDSYSTVDLGAYYAILPQVPIWPLGDFLRKNDAKHVEPGFKYNSGTNSNWLTVKEIRELIKLHIDAEFSIPDSKTF